MLKEEIEELKGSVENMEKQVHEQSLALEMLSELKKSSKRWFVISIVLLIALVISNVGWLIYESQWEETTETQTIEQHQDDTDNSNMSGVLINGKSISKINKNNSY